MLFPPRKIEAGFTLVELMTVFVIIMLIAMIGFPTFQEYQNRAYLAEAESTMGAMEKHLRTYFLDHRSFYSAAPQPANIPGRISLGVPATFNSSGGWNVIGAPVAAGTNVYFSYQSFAGQTPPDSTVAIEAEGLYPPTANMDLERTGLYTSNLENIELKKYAQKTDDLDFEFGNWIALAAGSSECIAACRGDDRCVAQCPPERTEDFRTCIYDCQTARGTVQGWYDCATTCSQDGDGHCTKDGDSDCPRSPTAEDICNGVLGAGISSETCSSIDGQCPDNQQRLDPDCYNSSNNGGNTKGEGENTGDENTQDAGDVDQGDGSSEGDAENNDPQGGSSACASFGVSTPVQFGIQKDIRNYSWVVMTAVGNFSNDTQCTLVVKQMQAVGTSVTQTDFIKVNVGR